MPRLVARSPAAHAPGLAGADGSRWKRCTGTGDGGTRSGAKSAAQGGDDRRVWKFLGISRCFSSEDMGKKDET